MLRTIKSKLILFSLCISLIPITVITTITFLHDRRVLKDQILRELTAVAESKKIHILSFLKAKRARTLDFSSDGFIRDSLETISRRGSQSYVVSNLNSHLKMNKKSLDPHLVAIAVVGLDGKIVSSTDETIVGNDLSGDELFAGGMKQGNSETFVGKAYHSPFLNKNCIFISTPLTHKSGGETIGVIINAYELASLSEITASRAGTRKTEEIYLVNRDKMMITDSRFVENAVLNQLVDTEPVRRNHESGRQMTGIYPDYRGVIVVGTSVEMPEYGWTLLAEVDKAEAFAPLKMLGIIALIIGGAGSAVTISLAILYSVSIAKPINKLKDATERFRGGDLRQRVAIRREDEIGALADSFNIMANDLAQETRKLTQAVEQSSSMVLVTDRDGDIEYVNPKFTQITGYTFDEAIGRNPRILKSGEQAPEVYRGLWEKIISGNEWHGEFHNRKKSGEPFWVAASIAPVKNSEGIITHFTGILEDTTERKRMESELKDLTRFLEKRVVDRTAKLKQVNEQLRREISEHKRAEEELAAANRELEAFCYSVSHDLRAPLRGIDGFSRILEDEFAEKVGLQGKDFIRRIRAASQRMDRLINDLLNLSRITRSTMRYRDVDMSGMVKNIIQELQDINPGRQVDVVIAEGISVRGDADLLHVAMSNLLDNAWKFTRNHSRAKIEFGVLPYEGGNAYYVRDDGAGFDMAYAHKLFGAFQRLHAQSEFEGTGVGLATVLRVIQRHGGRIWADGGVENGAVFYFTLEGVCTVGSKQSAVGSKQSAVGSRQWAR